MLSNNISSRLSRFSQITNMTDFASFATAASEKGMYLVDHENISTLVSEFEEAIRKSDNLCEVEDPLETPYASKYEARKILDEIASKLEATQTILKLEGKKQNLVEIDWRLSSCRVRLGTIAWECEEPHNTQVELETAVVYFQFILINHIAAS